jgi:hypothetical protein
MTDLEYILQEVTEKRSEVEQALCYYPIADEATMHTLRGKASALSAVENFVKDLQNKKVEE